MVLKHVRGTRRELTTRPCYKAAGPPARRLRTWPPMCVREKVQLVARLAYRSAMRLVIATITSRIDTSSHGIPRRSDVARTIDTCVGDASD